MGSVEAARKATKKRAVPTGGHEDVEDIEIDLSDLADIDAAFSDEQSDHYVIEDEDEDSNPVDETPSADDTDLGELADEFSATLRGASDDAGGASAGDDADIARFIQESFGENVLSDEDVDLAFPDFDGPELDHASIEYISDSEGPTLASISGETSLEGEGEVFDVGTDAAPIEVEMDIGRPTTPVPNKKKAKKSRSASGSMEATLHRRIGELGRTLEDRSAELRSMRDRVGTLNNQLVAANRRGAAISREFETYRRRSERDRDDHKKYAAEKVLKEFLGVFDNLERALEHAGVEHDGPLGQGVSMTLHQFAGALRHNGVERVEGTVGAKFDPVHHEAMGQAFSEDVPAGAIIGEMQAGFTLHGRLLRAAMVTVSRGREGDEAASVEDAEAGDLPAEAGGDEAQAEGVVEAAEEVADAETAPSSNESEDGEQDTSSEESGQDAPTASQDPSGETAPGGDSNPEESTTAS